MHYLFISMEQKVGIFEIRLCFTQILPLGANPDEKWMQAEGL